ncbi:MAG: hypothetical protein HUJ51_04750 [Eggerthellaceae bacterium]|nr:hypothetical protein [Eggerthellaceae bacterium]
MSTNTAIQFAWATVIIVISFQMFKNVTLGLMRRTANMDSLVTLGAGVFYIFSICNVIAGATGQLYFDSAGGIEILFCWVNILRSSPKIAQSVS